MKNIFILFRSSFALASLFSFFTLNAQESKPMGELHGNFQMDAQYYKADSAIGSPAVPEKMLMNGFSNLNYTYGDKFMAGIRYESYLNTLQGFPGGYKGNGIPYRFASYKVKNLDITVGNYYEQFGNGLIFRSYEERNLGYDNAMDGIRLRFAPYKGVYLKGFVGKQRIFFSQGEGIVRGVDAEIQANDLISGWSEKKTKVTLGGSFISKFQSDQDPVYILPENVAATAGRMNLIHDNFVFSGEYAYKINDPSSVNNFIYKPGNALYLNSGYSKKGFGISMSAKMIDNMNFRSDRSATLNNLMINYLPTLAKQHTYSLLGFYPYATQPNGEMAFQGEMFYKLKKDSKLGGPYGTDITINYSQSNGLDTVNLRDSKADLILGYKTDYSKPGKNYFKDFNFQVDRKFSKKWKGTFIYANQFYNKNIIQGLSGYENVYSNIEVLDITYKIKSDKALRVELQHLSTRQDQGAWAYAAMEYTMGSNWVVAILDQYNYGNSNESKRYHYALGSFGYTTEGYRIALSYGKQRAGIFCVGGVCRYVPASNGIALSITGNF